MAEIADAGWTVAVVVRTLYAAVGAALIAASEALGAEVGIEAEVVDIGPDIGLAADIGSDAESAGFESAAEVALVSA